MYLIDSIMDYFWPTSDTLNFEHDICKAISPIEEKCPDTGFELFNLSTLENFNTPYQFIDLNLLNNEKSVLETAHCSRRVIEGVEENTTALEESYIEERLNQGGCGPHNNDTANIIAKIFHQISTQASTQCEYGIEEEGSIIDINAHANSAEMWHKDSGYSYKFVFAVGAATKFTTHYSCLGKTGLSRQYQEVCGKIKKESPKPYQAAVFYQPCAVHAAPNYPAGESRIFTSYSIECKEAPL